MKIQKATESLDGLALYQELVRKHGGLWDRVFVFFNRLVLRLEDVPYYEELAWWMFTQWQRFAPRIR